MIDKELMESAFLEIQTLRLGVDEVSKSVNMDEQRYKSLLNLNQYLKLRSDDWTILQEKLTLLALSSLGRSYAHVGASIETLYDQMCCCLAKEKEEREIVEVSIQEALQIASENAKTLFGGKASSKMSHQKTALMITLPSNATDNGGELIKKLAKSHVNIFRINTAHDTPEVWREMAGIIKTLNLHREKEDQLKIFVDLAGPKIRTGKINQVKMPFFIGNSRVEKEIWLCHKSLPSVAESIDPQTKKKIPARIAVNKHLLESLKTGSLIQVYDMNHKTAVLHVKEIGEDFVKCSINKKLYLDEKSVLIYKKKQSNIKNIPMQIEPIRLFLRDLVRLSEKEELGTSGIKDDNGSVIMPARISCDTGGVLSQVHIGDKVFIDDGKVGLEVVQKGEDDILCKVMMAKESGVLIKEEKGINFPDSSIRTAALTELDKQNFVEVIDFADTLSISFCQNAGDVQELQTLLKEHNKEDVGIIAKIETKQALANMPDILKQLLQSKNSGVMIARGDLAIEVGFENLAHIQEALLDICDAAHMPVIWATQVLESKMKNNLPSRAEVSDAAMSSRAECVMLNKGPFTFDTIDVLTTILHDMHLLFKKNKQLLKPETLWKV
jgi:pyruvate kinase